MVLTSQLCAKCYCTFSGHNIITSFVCMCVRNVSININKFESECVEKTNNDKMATSVLGATGYI